jgi:hypothetical protein
MPVAALMTPTPDAIKTIAVVGKSRSGTGRGESSYTG